MTRKDRKRNKLLEYLSNPENEFLNREQLSLTVLGYKNACSLYRILSPVELDELEAEAVENRKARSSRQVSIVYAALYKKAKGGDVNAAKEWLDRTIGKVKDKLDLTGDLSIRQILNAVNDKGRKSPHGG